MKRIFVAVKQIISCGLEGKQWLACAMICALLLPIFTLPVAASALPTGSSESSGFEPVNESLPVWTEAWRKLNASIETFTTPYRAGNSEVALGDADKKTAAVKAADAIPKAKKEFDIESDDEAENSPNQKAKTSDLEAKPNSLATKPVVATRPATASPMFFNQLPDGEQGSVYSYENNLGSPKGQVEADAGNRAAADEIKHRPSIANFSFDVPFASLAGRGIDAGAGMSYNSRVWNKSVNSSSQDHFTYDVNESWIAPGFTSGFGQLDTQAVSNGGSLYTVVPRGLTDSDGTRHEFACVTYSGSACMEFRTNDGTFIRVPGPTVISSLSSYANSTFIATYPNGSRVYYAGAVGTGNYRKHLPVIIQDSNGNRIRIAYKSSATSQIESITDTLNRQIKFYYENDDKLVAITIPGMGIGEEIQTVRFYYQTLTLSSSGKFSGQITAPATIRVLQYVYMPGTKTGYKYEYDTNFGMIRTVSRYVGMSVSSTSTAATGSVSSDGIWAASTAYDYPDGSTALTDVPKYSKRTDDWQGRTGSPQETLYYANDPVGAADYTSSVTVKDIGFDVKTENTLSAAGLLKETKVSKIVAGTPTQISKAVYTWSASDRNLARLETTNDTGLIQATEFEYDGYNNQTKVRECGYASAGASCTDGSALRITETSYETGSGWIAQNILGLPKTITTKVSGTSVAKATIVYDNNGDATNTTRRSDMDAATHDTTFNPDRPAYTETICPEMRGEQSLVPPDGCVEIYHPGYTSANAYRGNVTNVTRFSDATLSSDSNANVNNYDYDIAGNVVSATLSCCNVKTIQYGASFGATGYAYPVKEIKGGSPNLETEATYNYNTGLVMSAKAENGQTTSYQYEADTLRHKKTIYPNGGYFETEYSDKLTSGSSLLPGFVRQTTQLESNKFVQSYSYFDPRGLGLRTASQTPDGWLISAVEYDNLGRARRSYNPFYGSTPVASIPGGTKFTEMTAIDALGRTTEITLQDNTKVYTYPNESTVTYTAPNGQSVTGLSTKVKDQANKERRQIADSLGRVRRVDEPDTNGSLGNVATPTQPTHYEYDGNDNLSKVIQSDGTTTQERRFKYDSLSRLIAEKQIEATASLNDAGGPGSSWTKVLKYSADGLLTDGYDARGVRTQFVYDGLNRVSNVNYTGESGYKTPNVTYTYDQPRSGYYNTGTLTKVETTQGDATLNPDAPSTKTEFDYDSMGRAVKHRQWIGAQQYDLEYGYNLAGQLTSEKYPSGKIVTSSYDANGRLSTIADSGRTYINSRQYQGMGGSLSSVSFGNGTTQTFSLSDRMQMEQQELKRGSETLQKYAYNYGQIDTSTGGIAANSNNGQLAKVESWIGTGKQWEQRFGYDSIGRLKESREYRGDNGTLTYKQNFDFDRFGNMYREAAKNNPSGQSNPLPFNTIESGDISKSSNRLATSTSYDNAGNVVTDNKFRTLGFGYDANGRMVKATKAATPEARSVYNAAGLRIAERVNDIWRFLIYDIGGNLVAEYGGDQSNDEGGVKYLLADWQGSNRAIINAGGYVESRMDYTAFGEDVGAMTGMRTTGQGFNDSNQPRQKYGLIERDEGTGLDHTVFRKHENRAGRWTSPDPYRGSMSTGNPQSFNRYSYVGNEPTNFVDPSGLFMAPPRSISFLEFCMRSGLCGGITTTSSPGDDFGGGGGGGEEDEDCPYQSFEMGAGKDGLTADQRTEIAQTAVGEASNYYELGEVSFIIAMMQNMLAVNKSYARGDNFLPTYGKSGGKPVRPGTGTIDNIINEFDGRTTFHNTGTKKLDGEKRNNGGKLKPGYVCDQLIEAINYLSQNNLDFSGDSMTSSPVVQNRGKGAYNKNVGNLKFLFQKADTKFYTDTRLSPK